MKHESPDGHSNQPLTPRAMSKRTRFTVGQAIIWIARRSKSGEALFHVPGHVIRRTPNRVTILARDYTRLGCAVHLGYSSDSLGAGRCGAFLRHSFTSASDARRAFRHSHGGIGAESAKKSSPAPRALRSNSSRTTFPGAYVRYHQHPPCLTSSWLT